MCVKQKIFKVILFITTCYYQFMLSNRVLSMNESATLAMAQKARELKEKGLDIISMSLGEPDFGAPEFLRTAAKDAINEADKALEKAGDALEKAGEETKDAIKKDN